MTKINYKNYQDSSHTKHVSNAVTNLGRAVTLYGMDVKKLYALFQLKYINSTHVI